MLSGRQLSPCGGCLKGSVEASEDMLSNRVHIVIQQHSLQLSLDPWRHAGTAQERQFGLCWAC